jgi:hypothetical protein
VSRRCWFKGIQRLTTDGDGTKIVLICPDVFGLAALNGCPDTDGDGRWDKDDACPDVFGLAGRGPDTDKKME